MAIPDGFWTANMEATVARMNSNLIQFDTAGNRPSSATKGLFYWATDTKEFSYDNGSAWVTIGSSIELTTKGDLMTYSTLPIRLAIGTTNEYVLMVDSTEATGMKWAANTAGATPAKVIAYGYEIGAL
jgi:hypothetical protein